MHKMKTAKNLKKNPPIIAAPAPSNPDADCQLELELCWCIQQLETALNGGKLNKKLQEDSLKNLRTLKSSTAPIIKKRQVMKAAFGDYRSKMKAEEKTMGLATKQIKFTPYDKALEKSSFVKKAAILQSGKDFKFNFNPETSAADTTPADTNANLPSGSTVSIAKDINLSSGGGFKFNFAIEADSDDIALEKLSIKS